MRIKIYQTLSLVITIIIIELNSSNFVAAFEPFTTGFAFYAGLAAIGGGGITYYDVIKLKTYCKYAECCSPDLIPHRLTHLENNLRRKLYGQHIVIEKLTTAILSHYKSLEISKKPLVMSFHGTAGVGKNYVANLIAEVLFEKGTNSQFFHIFHGSQYTDERQIESYKSFLEKEIFDGIDKCKYAMFVFDEVDKMPRGVFNSVTSMLDHHTLVKGRDFKKAIFIFLTNRGGDEISKVVHKLTNNGIFFRNEIKLHHLEKVALEMAYNGVEDGTGGLTDSELIKTAVIDFYFPFLPLEEQHVIECIKEEFLHVCKEQASPEKIDEVLKYIGFQEQTGFAHTGCKTIHPKVKAECSWS